ncbi:hypothetical protein [Rufibacter sp. LB8]|uniref:hypothetical protein n=1 Tax=Rufibacter sp. LB8 TaxID=2777781 RepID=UPI00178C534A|nr:hypothetical protein [Rufibacter sp. LB8]
MNYSNIKLALLPLLGLLVSGCSGTSNLQTSETDDVYFSSRDKVTYVEPVYPTETTEQSQVARNESGEVTERVSDPETYSNTRRNTNDQPYQYSYYDAPFGNPYWAYQSAFYSPSRYYRGIMIDPWMDPFYDPFWGPSMAIYDPWWGRPGFSIGIGLGYGRYNPWGYGYGYGYNPYRYGGYGYDSYYDGFYRGSAVASRNVSYGRRTDRSSNTDVAGRNISRGGRGTVGNQGTSRAQDAVVQPGQTGRTRRNGTIYQGGTQPGTQTNPQPAPGRRREVIIPSQQNRSNTGGGQTPPPGRRRREEPTPSAGQVSPRRESTPTRSYEPPTRSYEPPTRSSGSSGGSSSGSSSGSGRRGRN